jgi:hypothetical protein
MILPMNHSMMADSSHTRSSATDRRHQSTVCLKAGLNSFIRKLDMIDDTRRKLSVCKSVSRFLINRGLRHVFIAPCQALCTALAGLQQQQQQQKQQQQQQQQQQRAV